jgi:hypothetical protein
LRHISQCNVFESLFDVKGAVGGGLVLRFQFYKPLCEILRSNDIGRESFRIELANAIDSSEIRIFGIDDFGIGVGERFGLGAECQ